MTTMERTKMAVKETPSRSWENYISGNENEVLDLYDIFKTSQEQQEKQLIKYSIKNTSSVVGKMDSVLADNGFELLGAYGRLRTASSGDLVLLVSEEAFLSDEFSKMYDIVPQVEAENKSEVFEINISFMGQSAEFDDSAIMSDGYYIRFEKKSNDEQKTTPRPASQERM